MDQAFVERHRRREAYERARTGPPDGFPKLPDLPLGRYTDATFAALEQDRLWRRTWRYAAHESQLRGPGSYRVVDTVGAPVVLVRGDDGAVRAFANACRHRGAPVVRDACGEARALVCQYHSWTYDLQGRLVRVPDERDFVGLCAEERALVALRCEQWCGWLFVNEDHEAPPLREWLGPIPGILPELEDQDLRVVHESSTVVACNWKIMAEGFLEVYHLRTIHPQTVAGVLDHRGAVMGLYPNGHSSMLTPLRTPLEPGASRHGLPVLSGLSEPFFTTNPAFGLFPNLITPLDPSGFPFLVFWPLDAGTTRLDTVWFAPSWGDGPRPEVWDRRIAGFGVVMDEDLANLGPIQRSVEAAVHTGVPLSYQERRIWHLHAWIDRVIGPDLVPEHLRVPDLLAAWVDEA